MSNSTMYFQRDTEIRPLLSLHTELILTAFTTNEVEMKVIMIRV